MAEEHFAGRRIRARKRAVPRYDMAILHNPKEINPPSNEAAMKKFIKAAEAMGIGAEIITKDDYGSVAEFDALFIRETTSVNHHTYRFARRAQAEGLVVIDDPSSILKCTNKVYLAELLSRYRIAAPKTRVISKDNYYAVATELGMPIILKQPDSAFSQGVIKVEDDVPLDVACVIGCAVQTGVGAVLNAAKVEAGATVLVMGLGGVGISIVQGARIAGASRIIVSDPNGARREAAARFGATDAVDPVSEDVMSRVMTIAPGGVDYAFDAVGAASLIETGMWACRAGGTTVMVGAAPIDQVVQVPATIFMATERKLIGTLLGGCNGKREVPRLLNLWRAGRLDLEGMFTSRRPLAEVNEGFADMHAGIGLRTVLNL